MKSITRKLSLLLILGATLLLSSCLDSGTNNYMGNEEYSFITETTTGTVYARTAAGYFITSPKISLLTPGSAVFLTYEVNEETPIITVSENLKIYKVVLGREPVILEQTRLAEISAPETAAVYFEGLIVPPLWVTNSSQYFGDRWPFSFQYKAKKGESAKVSFYKVSEANHPENLNADVLIDVRIEKTGTPEAGAEDKLINQVIVANMSMIRGSSSEEENLETKQLKVKLRYFRSDRKEEIHISDQSIMITVQK